MSAEDRSGRGGMDLRSTAYAVWLIGSMLVCGIVCLPALIGPRTWSLEAIRFWAKLQIWGLEHIAGIRVEFRGLEHRPTGAALVAAKHQGQLDGVAPFISLSDPCFVLKRELMSLPFIGWFSSASGMVPIDRAGGSATVRSLSATVAERLAEPRQVIIFPEGTRKLPGAPPDYKSGVAALYRDLGLACTPMATNSGLHWPAQGLRMRPGVVIYQFLEPIPPGLKRAEFMRTLEARIEAASNALLQERL